MSRLGQGDRKSYICPMLNHRLNQHSFRGGNLPAFSDLVPRMSPTSHAEPAVNFGSIGVVTEAAATVRPLNPTLRPRFLSSRVDFAAVKPSKLRSIHIETFVAGDANCLRAAFGLG
jgi:hypothetical protein